MAASKIVKKDNVGAILNRALDAGGGLLRLTPTWVPRSFLHPGKRIKLAPTDWYALGTHRGGIDERWFASTTEAANEGRAADEGLSYCTFEGERFLLRDAVAEAGARIIGREMWDKYQRWPVYSKFFDNMGPIPHHMHQQARHAALTGQQGKPECYYFPPQLNAAENHFDYTFMGLEPGTTKADVRRCLENWDQGDNGILDLSRAYRLKPGTGWLIPAGVLHAPGSMCTYEPQWGSDVFGMFQSLVEGREVPWDLLVKDVPKDKQRDLDFIIEQLDWEKNVDPCFKQHNYVEPIVDPACSGPGYTDRWIDYGHFNGEQLVSAKELTLQPGAKCVLRDPAASGWITVQGGGRMGKLAVQTPVMIHFGQEPWDEVFITAEAAKAGVQIENTGGEPLVGLRYFGPGVHKDMPQIGDHRKKSRKENPPWTIRTIIRSCTTRSGRAWWARATGASRPSAWTRCWISPPPPRSTVSTSTASTSSSTIPISTSTAARRRSGGWPTRPRPAASWSARWWPRSMPAPAAARRWRATRTVANSSARSARPVALRNG